MPLLSIAEIFSSNKVHVADVRENLLKTFTEKEFGSVEEIIITLREKAASLEMEEYFHQKKNGRKCPQYKPFGIES